MSQSLLVWPMVIQAIVTMLLYVPMSRNRVAAVKAGKAKPSDFKLRTHEPEESKAYVNAISNQFELPVLFFAAVLTALVMGMTDAVTIALAWAFVAAKTAHTLVHVTTNRLKHRRPLFMAAIFICLLQWIWIAVKLL